MNNICQIASINAKQAKAHRKSSERLRLRQLGLKNVEHLFSTNNTKGQKHPNYITYMPNSVSSCQIKLENPARKRK